MLTRLRPHLSGLFADLPPSYWYLWLGTLVNRLGGFVIPFLTLYLTDERGITVGRAALMVSLFGAGSFLSSLVGGELSDRLGRRPVLLLSFFVTPVLVVALGLARAVWFIAVCTLVVGFFTNLYRPAVGAAIADLVPPEGRTRAYGYNYWAINLGAALAPVIAGFMATWNYLLLFVGDALTTLLFGLIVLWHVPETRSIQVEHATSASQPRRLGLIWQEPLLLAFAALTLLFGVVYMQGQVTLPVDMQVNGMSPAQYGLAIALNGALIVVLGIPASNAATHWRRFKALAAAGLLLGIGFGMTAISHSLPLYALTVAIWTLGEIAGASVAPAVVADLSPIHLRGMYQGIYGAAWGLSLFVGPLLGGWIFQRFGSATLWAGCFGLGCLLALGYLGLSRPADRRMAAVK
jgi:MFS family permease